MIYLSFFLQCEISNVKIYSSLQEMRLEENEREKDDENQICEKNTEINEDDHHPFLNYDLIIGEKKKKDQKDEIDER